MALKYDGKNHSGFAENNVAKFKLQSSYTKVGFQIGIF